MNGFKMVWMAGALAAGLVFSAQGARAQEQGEGSTRDGQTDFGDPGIWAFSTDTALEIRWRKQADGPSSTTLSILPAADYFIIKNLSLGGVIGVEYSKTGDNKTVDFQLGPRVGYDFEIGRQLSVWPKLGLLFAHAKYKEPGNTDKNNAVQLNLFMPLMFHPAPHFFVGFGPFLEADLNGDNRATQLGFKLTLGGWV